MDQFSISQLARFSGVKPHTIRVWEQRYQALKPDRSEGNTRYYDGEQLRRLLNIVSLTSSGYKISELGSMQDEQLFSLIREVGKESPGKGVDEYYISQLIAAGMDFDGALFEKFLSRCVGSIGLKRTYIQVIHPLLERIGLLWAGNSVPPAQEHFISNLLQQKIFVAIDALPANESSEDSWLLFLPENEFHELGLLFANFLIRSTGRKVIYLGSNVPLEALDSAIRGVNPANLLLFFVHRDFPQNYQDYLDLLENKYLEQGIFFSGSEHILKELEPTRRIQRLKSVRDLEKRLDSKTSPSSKHRNQYV